MTGFKLTSDARTRIETMVRTSDGFEIADVDLKLRGPGDLEGTQQSGIMELKLANLIRDEKVLRIARTFAQRILDQDPELKLDNHKRILNQLNYLNRRKTDWARIS
jgi:ATP-dependent DNA helicase RecG